MTGAKIDPAEGPIYTIGFIIDWTDSPYHISLLRGARDAARDHGMSLLAFVGGALDSPRPHEGPKNAVYQYINRDTVDGIIISGSSVGAYQNTEQLNEFCRRFAPMPVVSIAKKLEVTTSVLCDNKIGLTAAISHLICHHGHRKIAMIRGPDTNDEACERFETYRQTLAEHGLEFSPSLVVAGDFSEAGGRVGTAALLRANGQAIDAIVAANDDMAIGAISELEDRGISVPMNIAVIGFDDQALSPYFHPPLTTVRQPLYEQGREAVHALYETLRGHLVSDCIVLPTEPVIRQSCGCVSGTFGQHEIDLSSASSTHDPTRPEEVAAALHASLHARGTVFDLEHLVAVLEAFHHAVAARDNGELVRVLDRLHYAKSDISPSSAETWRLIATGIRGTIAESFTQNDDRAYAYLLADYMLLLLFSYTEQSLLFDRIRAEQWIVRITDMAELLNACLGMEDVVQLLVSEFPSLRISSCYFSLFVDDPSSAGSGNLSRLVLAYRNGAKEEVAHDKILYPRERLLPEGLIDKHERFEAVIELVFFGSVHLGLVLLDFEDPRSVAFAEVRRVFLRVVLKNVVQMQHMANQSTNLKWANDELYEAFNTLKETQQKLIQSEKMSALGGLVAGISHEINTPIGVSVTAASHLAAVTEEIAKLHERGAMRRSDLQKYVKTAGEASEMILSNLKRSHELIRSFKQVAVDQSTEEQRKFNVADYIGQILLSLKPTLKKTEHTVEVLCPPDLQIVSYPGALSQILTNFIVNSLMHGYERGQRGTITIEVSVSNDKVILKYTDDGKGIDASNLDRVFDPFFTTKRGQGGTGLGLNIVYNLVTQTLAGTVRAASRPGKGTVFTVIFPFKK